jgi:hypothetical protein
MGKSEGGKVYLDNLEVDGIILKWILIWDGRPRNHGSIPDRAKTFSLIRSAQAGSVARPDSYAMATMRVFPRESSGRILKLTTHLHLVPRLIAVILLLLLKLIITLLCLFLYPQM